MRLYFSYVFFLIAFASFAQNKPSHFKTEINLADGSALTTFLDVTFAQDQFTITSPKINYGILITISGKQLRDSLIGEASVPMLGKLKFKGIVTDQTLNGAFTSNDNTEVGTLRGVHSTEIRNDYKYLYPLIIKTVQDNIYSKDVLQTNEWLNFQKQLEALCVRANDDLELYLGFNMLTQSLPFTHFSLAISDKGSDSDENVTPPKSVLFEEKNNSTAYLLIKNFSTSQHELASILPKIVTNKNYKNLIVDLRNNPGGGIEAAFAFAQHITDKDIEAGYFLTNKLKYIGYQPELFQTLPSLQPKSTEDFINELKTTSGAKLVFKKPNSSVFTGAIYILTNSRTGSTSEPVVYALKNSKRATVIGGKTAGAMLAACPFVVSGKYKITLPIADFYTSDGLRLDKVGVSPDIEVKSDDALQKAMEIMNGRKI